MAFNLAQIMQVTSESLQKKVRDLLPSQQGFGADLQATNVIVPIVDLTAAAEGADLPVNLSQAASFGNITSFSVSNAATTIINTAGFWRILGTASQTGNGGIFTGEIRISDGTTTKVLDSNVKQSGTAFNEFFQVPFDYTVFLRSGDSIEVSSSTFDIAYIGSYYQVADINGNLVLPSGYTPQ